MKNQLRVQTIRFMDIMSGIGVLFYLGQNAAMGDWTEANNNPAMRDNVTAEDVQRVANAYFDKNQRNVLIINSKTGAEGEGESDESPMFKQMVTRIKSMEDPVQLEQMIGMFAGQIDQVTDPKRKASMEKLLEIANEHLKQLKARAAEEN